MATGVTAQSARPQVAVCIACRAAPAAPGSLNCSACYKRSADMGVSGAADAITALDAAFPGACGCPYAASRGHLHACKGEPVG